MKALCWNGINDLRVERVPDPEILNPRDAIIKVALSSVCGSDLHLINGYIMGMREGDIIGHEFVGEVVDVGFEVRNLKKGDRVIVGSVISCGQCWHCQHGEFSLCDNSNTHPEIAEKMLGHSPAGIFGYSHIFGGYAGSHAQYIRVPFADTGCFKIPEQLTYDQSIFISDAFPTGYMGAWMAGIEPGDVVGVWGAGGVGQMCIKSAYLMGASKVICIDRIPERLETARTIGQAEVLNYEEVDVLEALKEMTGGRGPDRCIDAVGLEAHSTGLIHQYDKAKQLMRMQTDRPHVLRQAIYACRKGGTVSVVGVYSGLIDKFPMGLAMNKGLTIRGGQMHAQQFIPKLIDYVVEGQVDPSFMITHKVPLEDGFEAYQKFNDKSDNMMRAVFTPNNGMSNL